MQPALEAHVGLQRVLDREERLTRLTPGLGALPPVAQEGLADRARYGEPALIDLVAERLELGHRVVAVGLAGVARGEDHVSVLRSRRAPAQVLLRRERLVVLVDPEDGHIEVEARVVEVVGVPAEKRDVALRREDEAHVRVRAVPVQVVLAARVERHHIAAKPRRVVALLFDGAHLRLHGVVRVGVGHARLAGVAHPRRHVFDGVQLIELEIRAFDLWPVFSGNVSGG